MDGQAILESLDNLWFFSSVFTSATPSPPLSFSSYGDENNDQPHLTSVFTSPSPSPSPPISFSSCRDENSDQPHLKDPPRTKEPNPRSPTLVKQPILSPNTGVLIETSSKSKDYRADTKMQIMKSLVVGELESSSESPWKGRKPRKEKKCCDPSMKWRKHHRWQEFSYLGFSHREVGWRYGPVLVLPAHQRMEKTCGFQKLESAYYMKMPPLSDGTAMKEHLKSWASAVACTVK
ncbi:hypothetical protein NE237_031284 [Protea cynaroides]|uniref:Uncharacterized protein n=1 Tax=Protea cynaroides TaxID=273540 RepID=A0A9Q0L162_9MAGN|nr:hypothetical protein NE237_031284 [Protea cynaroides]